MFEAVKRSIDVSRKRKIYEEKNYLKDKLQTKGKGVTKTTIKTDKKDKKNTKYKK